MPWDKIAWAFGNILRNRGPEIKSYEEYSQKAWPIQPLAMEYSHH